MLASFLCGLVLLVNLSTAVALGYGSPDEFVMRENANGGLYRVGHAQTDRGALARGFYLHRDRGPGAVRLQHGQEHRPCVHDFPSSGAPRADRGVEQAS